MLPQLILLRQTTVPTVIDSFYLLTLGSYRAFYILNWIVRAARKHNIDIIAVIFGIVQTAFYIDFAWVYWTRQRVKLRNGGVVDSEDLSRGWLLSRLLGHQGGSLDEEDRNGSNGNATNAPRTPGRGKWGARGISISADDEVQDPWHSETAVSPERDSKPKPSGFSEILEDDEDVNGDDGFLAPNDGANGAAKNGFMHGRE